MKNSFRSIEGYDHDLQADNTPAFNKKKSLLSDRKSLNITDNSEEHSQAAEQQNYRKTNGDLDLKAQSSKRIKEGAYVYQQSKKYTIDHQNPPSNLIIPQFSDQEISEAFKTLDMNKKNYITSQDLAFFLNVLEADATDAEIEEMIRMLDYEGTGRVYYQEFFKLATGKSLNPIGQAYPPTTELLMKKRANEAARRDEYVHNKEDKVNATLESTAKIDSSVLDDRKHSRSTVSKTDLNPKNSKGARIECLQNFLSIFKIDSSEFNDLYNSIKTKLNQRSHLCKYAEFLDFFGLQRSGDDESIKLFNMLSTGNIKDPNNNYADIR